MMYGDGDDGWMVMVMVMVDGGGLRILPAMKL